MCRRFNSVSSHQLQIELVQFVDHSLPGKAFHDQAPALLPKSLTEQSVTSQLHHSLDQLVQVASGEKKPGLPGQTDFPRSVAIISDDRARSCQRLNSSASNCVNTSGGL